MVSSLMVVIVVDICTCDLFLQIFYFYLHWLFHTNMLRINMSLYLPCTDMFAGVSEISGCSVHKLHFLRVTAFKKSCVQLPMQCNNEGVDSHFKVWAMCINLFCSLSSQVDVGMS